MPQTAPPSLRDAATIILAREKNSQLEIYLLQRSTKSGFMGGLYVFPGGVVDEQDRGLSLWQPCIDLLPAALEKQLCDGRLDVESATAFGVAAIRETLEEAGVLIASADGKSQNDFKTMATLRLEDDLPKEWFKSRILSDHWTLLFSNLWPWSHWITPKTMTKRFDTRFFIVLMPDNQTCVTDNRETQSGIWLTPQAALEQNLTGKTHLSPPTVVTLTQLMAFNTVSVLKKEITSRSWGSPIAPVMLRSESGPVIIEPWDPEFKMTEKIKLKSLSKKVLPTGSPFSRIWCDQGLWKPVTP